ncbi:MAG: o-succinylbenzoate--CoA ligase [Bacteroidetes Order II. Incertae sedis bacterium]|nr:o-succinylbenzoate--CoA ligase [Bacteroidetes Order II. bacterium]
MTKDPFKIPDPIILRATSSPQAVAIYTEEGFWTWADLDKKARRMATKLKNDGIGQGDILAICAHPQPNYMALMLACIREKIVFCPLSPQLPEDALHEQMREVGAKACYQEAELADMPTDAVPHRETPWYFTQHTTLVFTSGSSGRPQAALHSLGNHYWSADGSCQNIPLAPGHCWLLSLPLYHVSGLGIVFRCWFSGAALLLSGSLWETLQKSRLPTHVSLVGTQAIRLLEKKAPLDRLVAVLLGGSAMPKSVISAMISHKWPIFISYGMTEMTSQITTTPPNASLACLTGTSGRLLPHREVRLNADGEICVRGKTRFLGYWTKNDLVAPFDEQGWLATGDLGSWTEEGFLQVTGRKDNLFISGGENIQPEEIENLLYQVPGVQNVLVVAIPDVVYGQRPVAFIQGEVSAPDLLLALEKQLPRFKIPVHIWDWPLPKDNTELKPKRHFFEQKAMEYLEKQISLS